MSRLFNFSAGPAVLPEEVLKEAADEMLDYKGTGMSVMEMSHRSKAYDDIIKEAEKDIRELMNIPDNYKVLFLQGGASLQFAMVPMNLAIPGKKIGVCDTGEWSHKAMKEMKILGNEIDLIYNGEPCKFSKIEGIKDWKIDQNLAYVHICSNNTIYGSEYPYFPETGDVPLVADMSSDFMARPFDINKFGLVFAGSQKNIGPSGTVVVIIRKDLAARCPATVPTMLRYTTHIDKGSLFNTPSTFGIYMIRLVTDWLIANGGLAAMQKKNEAKAAKTEK